MADYISKQVVIDYLKGYLHSLGYDNSDLHVNGQRLALINAINDISAAKAADVQPIKHGYWEEVTDYGGWGDTHYRCSVCGEEWYLEDGKPKDNNMNFCPRCGTKMDAEPDAPWQSD